MAAVERKNQEARRCRERQQDTHKQKETLLLYNKDVKITRITNVKKPNKKAHTISMKMFKIQLTIFNYLFTFCA